MNRMPSRVHNFHTPMEVLANHVTLPSSLNLSPRIFGCVAYVHLHKNQRNKLDPCAIRCAFLGFNGQQKGYRCYNPQNKLMYVTMDVTFSEHEMFFFSEDPSYNLQREMTHEDYSWIDLPTEQPVCPKAMGLREIQPSRMGESVLDLSSTVDSCESSSTMEPNVGLNNHESSSTIAPNLGMMNREMSENNGGPEDVSKPSAQKRMSQPREQCSSELYTSVQYSDSPNVSRNNPSLVVPVHVPEDVHEVSPSQSNEARNLTNIESTYILPSRQNRGKPPDRYSPDGKVRYAIAKYVSTHRLSSKYQALVNTMNGIKIPTKVEEALQDPRWTEAMEVEMKALQKNKTWSVESLPQGKRPVGCKWVFTIKHKADGTIDRYKARLVAKGYTQTFGVDYQETFAPVAKMNTIRVLLSLAANFDWPLKQFDVKNAFLHGDLEEEVYMELPTGYEVQNGTGKVCRLKKALYGLKQSPRAWFGRFTDAMKRYGYR